jgi:hypothetical protein
MKTTSRTLSGNTAGILLCLLVSGVFASPAADSCAASCALTLVPPPPFLEPSPASVAPTEGEGVDPFLAATLGLMPFVSGLYVSDRPARGILFSAFDVLLVLGIYTARNTASGDPHNVKNYFLLMGANNLLDAWLSARYARIPGTPRAMILPAAGGVIGMVHWNF